MDEFGHIASRPATQGLYNAVGQRGVMENKVVLLIEDNPDDERLTLRALRRNNIMNEVVVACDGEEALDYLFGADAGPAPALVVLDLKLPGVTGLEVLQRIRSEPKTRTVPVVALTSSEDNASVRMAYAAGCNSYILKPTDPDEYADVVLQIGMYWLLLNERSCKRATN